MRLKSVWQQHLGVMVAALCPLLPSLTCSTIDRPWAAAVTCLYCLARDRTLHTAQDAQDTKWVMQQWVARGYPTPKAVLKAVKVAALAGPERPVGADAAEAAVEPIEREVFKVVVSSGDDGYGKVPARKSRRPKKGSSGKKGFSRR